MQVLEDKSILAVITARESSKRLKNKNIKYLNKKPLITWTIEAAKSSKYIDEIIVSTDSQEIRNLVEDIGVRAPFLRSVRLSSDTARSIDVVTHALNWLKTQENKVFDYVILLQPTSPFREAKHIDEALSMLMNKNADAIISVCETEHSPLWSNVLKEEKSLVGFLKPEHINTRSQDLECYYRLNGALYICDVQKLLDENTFFIKNNIYAYEMNQMDSVDIDTELDFLTAEAIVKYKEQQDAE